MTTPRRLPLVLLCALLTSACEQRLDGTWDDPSGEISYEFRADGRVRIRALGSVVPGDYRLDGDRVVVTSPQGTVVLQRDGDELSGPMGARYLRRSEN